MSETSQSRFLSFHLNQDEFAISLENIREVIAFSNLTPIPNSPEHFLGLMSLREEIIPVLDMRLKLGLIATLTHDTSIVICNLRPNIIGIVVDSINTVVTPLEQDIFPLRDKSSEYNVDYVTSVIRKDNKLTLVLAIEKLLSTDDKVLIRNQQEPITLDKVA